MEEPVQEQSRRWMAAAPTLYVEGWREARGERRNLIDPATGEVLVEIPFASSADVDRAVTAARRAFNGPWRRMTRRDRQQRLLAIGEVARRHRAELATLISLENGKLYREAYDDDMPDTADVFDYYAGWIDKVYGETCPVEAGYLNYTLREPIGVCALIAPWNFPLLLAAWKLAPALAMGNTAVLKPSPFTPLSLMRFVDLIAAEVDLPPGVINLVVGDAEVGEALTRHEDVDKVSFTGSTGVGRRILQGAADSNLKAVNLELGGKSANIIFDDVPDLDFAMNRSFQAMFSQKGEKCSEPTRFLVQRGLYAEVVERLARRAEEVVCGNPFDARSEQGAQCNGPHFERVMTYIEAGRKDGARLRAGGERDTQGSNANGWFVRPTIFDEVSAQMEIAREEIFGPVLAISPFDTEEEAIRLANDSRYGLAAGLWTREVSRAHRVAAQLDAGMIFVNRYGCYDFSSPFGGFKQSGWGKEMGVHSLAEYTRLKSVWLAL